MLAASATVVSGPAPQPGSAASADGRPKKEGGGQTKRKKKEYLKAVEERKALEKEMADKVRRWHGDGTMVTETRVAPRCVGVCVWGGRVCREPKGQRRTYHLVRTPPHAHLAKLLSSR